MQKAQVKSATRVIEVLEYFRVSQQPRSMTQVAGDLGGIGVDHADATGLESGCRVLGGVEEVGGLEVPVERRVERADGLFHGLHVLVDQRVGAAVAVVASRSSCRLGF